MNFFLNPKSSTSHHRGQTATELAIFGTILVFVIGVLVSYSLTFTYSQQLQQQAYWKALSLSHATQFDDPKEHIPLQDRAASVAFFEDRQMPDLSNAFGIMQRSPVAGSASAVFTRHLYASIKSGMLDHLPRIHLYINGQEFIFTTANFKNIAVRGGRRKVVRGTTDYDNAPAGDPNIYWKWLAVGSGEIGSPDNNLTDIDDDGKEEQILEVKDGTIYALDSQEGELDLTVNDFDVRNGIKKQGIIAEGGAEYRVEPGTQIHKEETTGSGNTGSITTTTTVKGLDIITRIIQLNPKHTLGPGESSLFANVIAQIPGRVTGGCLDGNKEVTCFDQGSARLYVRSRFGTNKNTNWSISK